MRCRKEALLPERNDFPSLSVAEYSESRGHECQSSHSSIILGSECSAVRLSFHPPGSSPKTIVGVIGNFQYGITVDFLLSVASCKCLGLCLLLNLACWRGHGVICKSWGLLSSFLWAAQFWTVEGLTGQSIAWGIVGSLFAVGFLTGGRMIVRPAAGGWLCSFFSKQLPRFIGCLSFRHWFRASCVQHSVGNGCKLSEVCK